jgi:hypothetical protein
MFGVALRLPLNNTDYIIGWYYLERDGESIDSPGGRYFPDENIYSQAAASLATRLATVSGAKTSKTQASLKLFNTLYAFFPNPKPYLSTLTSILLTLSQCYTLIFVVGFFESALPGISNAAF